jgi:HD-GYP domain-containing protein (c-di-GMP phosphodiesterase class II)
MWAADRDTFDHCSRVAASAVLMAPAVGLLDEAETALRLSAFLHDLGKVRVPDALLQKPGPLTEGERRLVERHPTWGVDMLGEVECRWNFKPGIQWHHEHYDGSGYPDGLRGEEIPLGAQVVGILDVFDALTSRRPYRPALLQHQALDGMYERRGWWSERVFRAFLDTIVVR